MGAKADSSKRAKIIELLLKHQDSFISGQQLSDQLGFSRTALWKHMNELRHAGYEIESMKKSGYRLVYKPNVISAVEVQAGLITEKLGHSVHYEETCESTQEMAHRLAFQQAPEGTLVTTDEQVGGRGRLGRPWHSPKGSGIWTSLILRPNIPPRQAPQLTLLVAVAVVKGIKNACGLDCEIKWPNDILIDGKKIVGVLTELQADPDRVNAVITGIGINVNIEKADFPKEIQEKATSLQIEAGKEINRAHLLQHILVQIEQLYKQYLKEGFSMIKLLWESYTVSLGKVVTAKTLEGEISGYAKGITDDGFLMIEDEHHNVHYISSADIELSSSKT